MTLLRRTHHYRIQNQLTFTRTHAKNAEDGTKASARPKRTVEALPIKLLQQRRTKSGKDTSFRFSAAAARAAPAGVRGAPPVRAGGRRRAGRSVPLACGRVACQSGSSRIPKLLDIKHTPHTTHEMTHVIAPPHAAGGPRAGGRPAAAPIVCYYAVKPIRNSTAPVSTKYCYYIPPPPTDATRFVLRDTNQNGTTSDLKTAMRPKTNRDDVTTTTAATDHEQLCVCDTHTLLTTLPLLY